MIPSDIAFDWHNYVSGYLDTEKEKNEYDLFPLKNDAPDSAKEAYKKMIDWKKTGLK